MKRRLLEFADDVRAIAATGLHFTTSHFDRERYERLFDLAVQLAAFAEDPDDKSTEAPLRELYEAADDGYVTPKLDVRMAVFDAEQRVLLVRERADSLWALPGGYIDVGDSPAGAAERETLEEANLDVRTLRLAGIFDYRLQPLAPPVLFHIHKLIFIGERREADAIPSAGPEVLEARFFPVRELPELSSGRTLPLHVATAHERWLDPALPTHFE